MWQIKLYNTQQNRRSAGMWEICCWIHILAWIYSSCIVFYKALVLDGSLQYVQYVPCAAFLLIFILCSIIWYCRVQSPAASKGQDARWCSFRWLIPLSIGYVWESCIDRLSRLLRAHIVYEIDTAKIISEVCWICYCLHDFIWLNSIVCHFQTTRCTMI